MFGLKTLDERLDDTLDNIHESIQSRLQELVPLPRSSGDLLCHAMHSGVLAPGKRYRPVLMMLACHGLGGKAPCVLDLACAVEMVHTASLFLDDLPCMDNAQTRRGQPAAHVQYGEDVAMLGAVALLSEALRLVASVRFLPADLRLQFVVILSKAIGPQGLAKGQYLDLHHGTEMRQERDIAGVNGQKTGALFSAALEMTAIACRASDSAQVALKAAAIEIGQAFQMRDDLDDGSDLSHSPIKDRHKDVGKPTLVSLLGREVVQQQMHRHLADAVHYLGVALPVDKKMAQFTLRAFGLKVSDLATSCVAVEVDGLDKRRRWQLATG